MRQSELKNPGSKPVKWNSDLIHTAYLLALLGATDQQIADVMDVDPDTITRWKKNKPEFLEALNRGKLGADTKVVQAFYKCATGYYYEEDDVRVVRGEVIVSRIKKWKAADPWTCSKWLALRQRGNWSETTKIEINNTNLNINKLDLTGVTFEQLKMLRDIGLKQLTQNAGDNN